MKGLLCVCLCAVVLAGSVYAQSKSDQEKECNKLTRCEECVKPQGNDTVNFDCYWCTKPSNSSPLAFKCRHFSFNTAIPVDGVECTNLLYFVGNCRVNVLAIVIMIVLSCFIIVVALCCVCCCCCYFFAKRRQKSRMVEEERYLDEKEQIRQRSSDRRAERKAKNDEIRKKYGLNNTEEGAGTYKRLD